MIAAGARHQQRVGSEPIGVDEEIDDGPEPQSVVTVDFPPADIPRSIGEALGSSTAAGSSTW